MENIQTETQSFTVTRDGEVDNSYYNQLARQERLQRLQSGFNALGGVVGHLAKLSAEKAGKGALLMYASAFDDMHGSHYATDLRQQWDI